MGVFEIKPMPVWMKYFGYFPSPHSDVGTLAQTFSSLVRLRRFNLKNTW